MGVSPTLVMELIDLLEEDVPARLAGLKLALVTSDANQVMLEAHHMKGSLSNLGLARMADLASCIETLARKGHLGEVPALVDALPAAYQEALLRLRTAYPQS